MDGKDAKALLYRMKRGPKHILRQAIFYVSAVHYGYAIGHF